MRALDEKTEPPWELIAPHLDEGLNQLNASDRDAIVLRFLKRQDLRVVGAALGISEDAAQKRVSRALEKLRNVLSRRGVVLKATALSSVLAAKAVTAAPSSLVVSVTAASLAASAGTESTLTLLKFMAVTKLKAGIISAIVAASVVTPLVLQHQAQARLRRQDEALRQQTEGLANFQADNERFANLLAQAKGPRSLSDDQLSELLRLRGEIGRLGKNLQEMAQSKTSAPMSRADVLASRERLWLARASQLKQWLEEHPSEKIPELQFVDDSIWIGAIYPDALENEDGYRRAMRIVRINAEQPFRSMLERALRQYAKENAGQFPTDLSQLKPYFKSPIDDAILQRYEIVSTSRLVSELQPGGDWAITQKAPVNQELDIRVAIGLTNSLRADERVTNRWVLVH
jgi:type II secretory pathway pseudopilin PulG